MTRSCQICTHSISRLTYTPHRLYSVDQLRIVLDVVLSVVSIQQVWLFWPTTLPFLTVQTTWCDSIAVNKTAQCQLIRWSIDESCDGTNKVNLIVAQSRDTQDIWSFKVFNELICSLRQSFIHRIQHSRHSWLNFLIVCVASTESRQRWASRYQSIFSARTSTCQPLKESMWANLCYFLDLRSSKQRTSRNSANQKQVLRWSALAFGVFYGFSHQRSIKSQNHAAHAQAEYKHKEDLIEKAKLEFKKKQNPQAYTQGGDGMSGLPMRGYCVDIWQ